MQLDRRSFLTGLLAVAAPAIVRPTSIMPVKSLEEFGLSPAWRALPDLEEIRRRLEEAMNNFINPPLLLNRGTQPMSFSQLPTQAGIERVRQLARIVSDRS